MHSHVSVNTFPRPFWLCLLNGGTMSRRTEEAWSCSRANKSLTVRLSLSLSLSLAAQCNSTTSPCLSLSQLNASQSKLSALICCSSENTLCPADIILTAVMWCDTPLLEWKLLWQESYKYETPCSNTLLHNRSQWHTISSLTLENNIYRYHIQYIMY